MALPFIAFQIKFQLNKNQPWSAPLPHPQNLHQPLLLSPPSPSPYAAEAASSPPFPSKARTEPCLSPCGVGIRESQSSQGRSSLTFQSPILFWKPSCSFAVSCHQMPQELCNSVLFFTSAMPVIWNPKSDNKRTDEPREKTSIYMR